MLSAAVQAQIDQSGILKTTVETTESGNSLKKEIEELGGSVVQVALLFVKVIDAFTSAIGSASWDLKWKLGGYLGQWIARCVDFGKALLLSVNVAADGLDTANEFLDKLVPVLLGDSQTKEYKKDQITKFVAALDGKTTNAQQMSQNFIDLQKGIEGFVDGFKSFLDGYNLSDMEKRIKQLDVDISNLVTTLDGLRKQVESLTKQLEAAEAAAAATGILGFLCPFWWIGTAIAASQASAIRAQLRDVQSQRQRTVNDINSKRQERANLQADIQTIPLLRAATNKALPDVREIVQRVGQCANIWAALRADSQAIQEKLEYANNTDSIALFKARVGTAATMYGALRDCLAEYKKYLDQSRELRDALKKYGINI